MLICHCNVITDQEIEGIIVSFLREDPWQLVVPAKVYRELGKRGRCCGCFPNVVDIIARVTEDYHLQRVSNSAELIDVQQRLAALRQTRNGGRREGRSTGHRAA
ncbi:MAG TPA: (2Fe-2S)-binding protein [Devosiaceae bacterium]|jgi:bacterioferritin-associated ferredoxin